MLETVPGSKIEQERIYPEQLEGKLGLSQAIDQIEAEFDKYKDGAQQENTRENELDTLRSIKVFLYRNKNKILEIIKDTQLPGFDCLSMSVITCILAYRKGYEVKIGRPDKLSRYLHALIIMKDGNMFKVAGKSRNYKVESMTVEEVAKRLKYTGPFIRTINSIKSKVNLA
jgi:hypothetical protein